MITYVSSPAAEADPRDIWDYTNERWADDKAEKYVREIQRALERIMGNPLIGRWWCDEVLEATGGARSDPTHCITG